MLISGSAPPVRPRGGFRQRLARESRSRSRSRGRAPSGGNLLRARLRDFAWGDLSAMRLGEYCRNGMSDGLNHPVLVRLGKIAAGASSHNLNRRLLDIFGVGEVDGLITTVPHSRVDSVILPHDLFGWMAARHPQHFREHLSANKVQLRAFWTGLQNSVPGRELMARHPFLVGKSPQDLETCIPLLVHCDGAPVTKKEKVLTDEMSRSRASGARLLLRASGIDVKTSGSVPAGLSHIDAAAPRVVSPT